MKADEIDTILTELSLDDRKRLLMNYGHALTIMCREAYEFQGPGVIQPRLLRDANEIHHRVYQALRDLEQGEDDGFAISGISHWISECDRRDEIQNASIRAFQFALDRLQ